VNTTATTARATASAAVSFGLLRAGDHSREAAEGFFTDEVRELVTGLYGAAPSVDFVEIAEIVDNSVISKRFPAASRPTQRATLARPAGARFMARM
jgi:hypothetical protein